MIRVTGAATLDIKPCSIDLTLSEVAYEMRLGSIKPSCKIQYEKKLESNAEKKQPSDGIFLLQSGHTYVFKLREELTKDLGTIGIHGQATAKSTVGRLDILARLIVDGMDTFECFDAKKLDNSSGRMYLEVTPITFSIKVKPGESLSQLRLFYGSPKDSRIDCLEVYKTVLGLQAPDHVLRLNLAPDPQTGACAFHAKKNVTAPILISSPEKSIDPGLYWNLVSASPQERIQIDKDEFYILRSKERLWLPDGIAIYCEASDETIGEMRIHYAGFVHPGFGQSGPSGGTPLIFEVRGHQVKANLRDGEKMANLIFYRMSKPAHDETPYDKQELKLSKMFSDWKSGSI